MTWVWVRQLLVWGAAGLTIVLSYRLYNRYRRRYLRDWFLFVVLFNLGLYIFDLLKTILPGLIRPGNEPAQQIEMVFHALLIRPLIFLGLILFLRFIIGLIEIRVHWGWRLAALIFLAGYIACLVFPAIRFFSGGRDDWYRVMIVLSDWMVILGVYGAVAFMLVKIQQWTEEPKRQLLRNLGIIFFVSQTALLFFPSKQPQLLAGFFLILPPLLYLWRIHRLLFIGQRRLILHDDDLALFLEESGLTQREQEIALLICRGRGNRQIADELFVSLHTVKHHVTAIFRKLRVRNRIQLANRISNQFRVQPIPEKKSDRG